METDAMMAAVRKAWSPIPTPPAEELAYLDWECGEDSVRVFSGVAPVEVDISSVGFLGCAPLFVIRPKAAAAYFGTYILALLDGLWLQERSGLFVDVVTRAHAIHCLTSEKFWRDVIRPYLSEECHQALSDLSVYLGPRRELLDLPPEEIDLIKSLARAT